MYVTRGAHARKVTLIFQLLAKQIRKIVFIMKGLIGMGKENKFGPICMLITCFRPQKSLKLCPF